MAKAVVRGSLISLGLAGALCALATQAVGASFVVPGSKAAGLESCVEPTDFMRRNHMEVIKHQRDETVHSGIRSTRHSLAGCIECHATYTAEGAVVPVNDPGQFCLACHEYAAVGMNCFGCHANVPAPTPEAAAAAARGEAWHPPVAQTVPGESAVQLEVRGQGQ